MKKVVVIMMLCVLFVKVSFAQTITPEQYVAQYKDLAIREMKRMGVPAAITLAQGLLETESGNSDLLKKSNNHFGIKCKATWTSAGVSHDDDAKGECFRVYKTAEDSYRDHSNFLRGSDRYSWLFRLNPLDYKAWAYGLKKSGYATNDKYPQILINNIEQYNLQQYSLAAADDVPKVEPGKYKDDPEVADDAVAQPDVQVAKVDEGSTTNVINGCKFIFASKGTSLLAIATKNNIDLSKLLDYNDLTQDGILAKDQRIFLQKKMKEGDQAFYIVQDNETLYDVSQKTGIQLACLLDYNKLTATTKVYPGTKLTLKQPVKNIPQVIKKTAPEPTYYNVGPREGLYSISKKFGVAIDQIKEWNHLTSDSLHLGQQLVIYQK